MVIEFYEEFPNEKNLAKLKTVKFPTRVFIAAKSLEEFRKHEVIAKKYKKDVEVAYWPLIPNSYWISPFSNTEDLMNTFEELNKIKNPLLIDLELPLKKRSYFLKNLFSLRKNKKLIKNFLEKNKERITTAEYPFTVPKNIMRFLGLGYDVKYEKSIMWYSSMFSKSFNKFVKKKLTDVRGKDDFSVSLGTIDTGILGNEPILSSENLEKDLEFVHDCGFKKIIIFRLSGLNEEYLKVLNKFT